LCIVDMSTVYTNETHLSFWLRLCRARLFVVNKNPARLKQYWPDFRTKP
jgi:hypothetical protein